MVRFFAKQTDGTVDTRRSKNPFANRYVLCVSMLLCLSVWIFLAIKIPINNDEAIHFQPIACRAYPFSWMHQFRERCGEKDLRILDVWLPIRSFWYAGASSALFFVPIWWMFNDPLAIRVWEGVLWLLSGFLMSRVILVPWSVVASVVLLSIPFLAQHLLDTGPIAWQLVMLQSGILLILKVVTEKSVSKSLLYGVIAGVCAFLAIEQKVFVVYATPLAVYLLGAGMFARCYSSGGSRLNCLYRRLMLTGLVAISVLGLLLRVLFFATDRNGIIYWKDLKGRTSLFSLSQFHEWSGHFWDLFSRYGLRPAGYFHRNYIHQLGLLDSLAAGETAELCLLVAFGIICLLLLMDRKWGQLILVSVSPFVAIGSLFLIARSTNSAAGHHVIFAHVVALVGIAIGISSIAKRHRLISLLIVGAILYVNVKPSLEIAELKPDLHADPTRNELFKIVDQEEFARKYLVVHTDWGTYFIDALFGPKSQAVTWFDRIELSTFKPLAQKANRQLAFIKLHDPNWDAHGKEIGLRLYSRSSSGQWDLWVEDEHALTP
jgi:hypothetical protein